MLGRASILAADPIGSHADSKNIILHLATLAWSLALRSSSGSLACTGSAAWAPRKEGEDEAGDETVSDVIHGTRSTVSLTSTN